MKHLFWVPLWFGAGAGAAGASIFQGKLMTEEKVSPFKGLILSGISGAAIANSAFYLENQALERFKITPKPRSPVTTFITLAVGFVCFSP